MAILYQPCHTYGCPILTLDGYCEKHSRQRYATRATRHERGYTNRWLRLSRRYLAAHPICVRCKSHGTVQAAEVTDHIVPISKGGSSTIMANLQALCCSCNTWKGNRSVARFGPPCNCLMCSYGMDDFTVPTIPGKTTP